MEDIKEKSADELFKELGYEKDFEQHEDWNTTIYNSLDTSIEFTSEKHIMFTKKTKYKTTILDMQELKAINKKTEELRMVSCKNVKKTPKKVVKM